MAEMIEGLAPSANSDLLKFIENLKKANTEIERANRNPIRVGGGGGNNRQALAEIEELNRRLAEQAAAIERLTQARVRSNQRTQEEITNNRLLAQNASLAAQANSTFAYSYQRLTAQQAIASRNLQDLVARGRTGTQTQREYNAELRNAQSQFTALNTRVLAADRAVGRFNRNVGNYPQQAIRGLKDLVGAFGIVGGVAAFAGIAKSIFDITRETQSLNLALKQVTGSQENFIETQGFLNRISEAYGIEINGLTRSYTGFLAASQNAIEAGDISATQIQEIFESVSKASGAMGLSVEQQQGAFLALQQMISKGNVQAEEIRGQLAERLPGAFGILAKSMGVTEQVLNQMLKDGKVLAAEVLPAFAKQLEKAYGVENLNRVESLAASTTRLSNSWTDFVKELNEGQGAVGKFFTWFVGGAAEALDALNDLIKSRDSLLKDLADTSSNRGRESALSLINENAGKGGSMEDWATSVKNKVIPQIQDLENKLATAKNLFASSDDEIWKFFDINKWKQYYKSKDDIDKYTEALNYAKGELAAAEKVLKGTEPTKEKEIELTDKQRKAIEKLAKERQKAYEEEMQNQYRLKKLILESEKQTFGELMADASLYYEQRETAANDYTQKEIALAELTRKEGLRKAKDNKTLQLIVWEEYYKDFAELSKKGEENIRKLQEESFKEFTDYHEKFKGEGLSVVNTEDLATEFFKKQKDDAEKAAEKVKELKDATDEYIRSISSGYLNDAGFGALNMFTALDKDGKSPFDKLIEGADSVGEKFAVTFNAIGEVAQDAFAFINQNSQAYFDNEASRLQRMYDLEISFNEGSETAKAEIRRQYDEKQRELRRRESQAQKEQALFNIAINTAQGITAALTSTPPNVPLSIIIGAIGVAQAALVAGREIPQYKMGTDNHKGGLAIVGDGGKHELVHQPTLGWSVTPNKDTMVNLEKGSKVFPDLSKVGLFDSGLPDMIKLQGSKMSTSEMDYLAGKLAKVMPRPSNVSLFADKNGIASYVTTAGGKAEDRNRVLSIGGKRV